MLSIRTILPLFLLLPLAAADNPLGVAMAGGDQLWERGDLTVFLQDAGEQPGTQHYVWRLRDRAGQQRPELELAVQAEWSGDARNLVGQVADQVLPRQPTLVVIAAGHAAARIGQEEKKDDKDKKEEKKEEEKPADKKEEKKVDTGLDAAGFAAVLKEAVGKLKEAGVEVIVLGPSLVSDTPEAKTPADEKVEAFNRVAGEVARAAEVPYVDLRAPCLDYLKAHPPEAGKPALYAGEGRYTAAWHDLVGALAAKAIGERMAALPMRIDVQDQPFIEKAQVEIPLRRVRKGAKVDIWYTLDGKEPSAKVGKKFDKPFFITGGNTTLRVLAIDTANSTTATAKALFTKVKARPGETLPRRELGLEWALYQGSWPMLPEFSAQKPAATGIWHAPELAAYRENPVYAAHTEKLGMRFAGYIDIPVEGVYRFETTSDDGSRMWIDDELVVDNDGGHGMRFRSGRVALREGLHKVRVDWFQGSGGMGLEVWWSSEAGIRRTRVPDNAWVHNPAKPYDWNPPPPKKEKEAKDPKDPKDAKKSEPGKK